MKQIFIWGTTLVVYGSSPKKSKQRSANRNSQWQKASQLNIMVPTNPPSPNYESLHCIFPSSPICLQFIFPSSLNYCSSWSCFFFSFLFLPAVSLPFKHARRQGEILRNLNLKGVDLGRWKHGGPPKNRFATLDPFQIGGRKLHGLERGVEVDPHFSTYTLRKG